MAQSYAHTETFPGIWSIQDQRIPPDSASCCLPFIPDFQLTFLKSIKMLIFRKISPKHFPQSWMNVVEHMTEY